MSESYSSLLVMIDNVVDTLDVVSVGTHVVAGSLLLSDSSLARPHPRTLSCHTCSNRCRESNLKNTQI